MAFPTRCERFQTGMITLKVGSFMARFMIEQFAFKWNSKPGGS
jgi:hypothetical protein